MKRILVAAALSLAIILVASFAFSAPAAWSGFVAPGELHHVLGELHQFHHIVLFGYPSRMEIERIRE